MDKKVKKTVFNVVVVFVLFLAIIFVCSHFVHFGDVEFTDNAQVRQHITVVNTRVPGFIRKIYFEEYQTVHKGDTLVVIEDAEFRLQLAQAEANLANALAGKEAMGVSITTTQSNIEVSDAGVAEVRVQLENAKRELDRFEKLLAQQAVTPQQYDNVKTQYEATKARYDMVSRQKQSTSLVKSEQTRRLQQTEAGVRLAQAAVELARLNLSYTVIVAACDGVTGRKHIQEGELMQPGQALVNIVNSEELWVVANYRETQLNNIREGQPVEIEVDAVEGVVYKGIVRSISEATGASFSLIPQDNSAGNFVKVEQRVPVRIEFTKENKPEDIHRLRAGLNVECLVKY